MADVRCGQSRKFSLWAEAHGAQKKREREKVIRIAWWRWFWQPVKGAGRGEIQSDVKRNCPSKVLKPISNHLHVTRQPWEVRWGAWERKKGNDRCKRLSEVPKMGPFGGWEAKDRGRPGRGPWQLLWGSKARQVKWLVQVLLLVSLLAYSSSVYIYV